MGFNSGFKGLIGPDKTVTKIGTDLYSKGVFDTKWPVSQPQNYEITREIKA